MNNKICLKLVLPSQLLGIYKHFFEVLGSHLTLSFEFDYDSEIEVSAAPSAKLRLSKQALDALLRNDFKWLREHFDPIKGFENEDGKIDYVTSALYMLNYLQEYGNPDLDYLNRFPFGSSYQARFDVADKNLVFNCFIEITKQLQIDVVLPKEKSRIFVSHDIDDINSAFIEDGFSALKQGKLSTLIGILFRHVLQNPDWLNMDLMMDINDEYDVKSTFFWLVDQKKEKLRNTELRNADYNIKSKSVLRQIDRIKSRGFENGLHKGISSDSFLRELSELPFSTIANRNHFLKMTMPQHIQDLNEADIKLDFTLGFAEEYGLRNSFPIPIRPYDFSSQSVAKTLFVPLMIMDTTNWIYKKKPLSQMKLEIIDLIDQHKHNAVISILWHNKYFTELKFDGYLELYKSILDYCRSNSLRSISQDDLLAKYYTPHTQ